jgi:hypothetical protein
LTSDYAGARVPVGSAPDIGAYEYQPRRGGGAGYGPRYRPYRSGEY